jgi:uncharacterized protein YndB with AHSA1/START domain
VRTDDGAAATGGRPDGGAATDRLGAGDRQLGTQNGQIRPETHRNGDHGGEGSGGGPGSGGVRRLPQTGAAEVVVAASPEAVWAVLADVTRIGEWSHECRGAEWLDGATAAVPGARFRGRNRAGALVRWARVCVIREVDPPRELVWETVGPPLMRDASLWRVRLDPVDGGTRICQEFRILSMAAWADRAVAALIPTHRDRSAALAADLRRLGEVSAGGSRTS